MCKNYVLLRIGRDAGLKSGAGGKRIYSQFDTKKAISSWLFGLFLLFGLFMGNTGFAQVNFYGFSAGTGQSLDPMTTTTTIVSSGSDDGSSSAVTIPFTFTYAGTGYTQFVANANGALRFGSTAITTGSAGYTNSATNAGTISPVVMAYWDDLATGSNGKVHYFVDGVAPNRIVKVEWNVTVPRNTTGSAGAKFQCWLYETTNAIKLIYGSGMAVNTDNNGASIGLATSSSVYLTVATATNTASSSTFTITNTAAIPAGTVYTFTTPVACAGTPSDIVVSPSAATICPSSTQVLSVLSGTSGITGYSYQWETSADGVSGWGNVSGGSGATTQSYTTPAYVSGTQYYRLRVTCANGGGIGYSNVVSVSGPAAPSTQASNIVQGTTGLTSMTVSWTAGNGNNRSVYVNTTNSFTDPVNGNSPGTVSTTFANAGQQLIFDGSGTSVSITGLSAGTTYYFRVYESRKCTSPAYYYNTTSPASASFTTLDKLKYTISRNTGITYTPVSGSATTLNTPANASSGVWDDISFGPITFFPFNYGGTTVTQFRAVTNGFMTLNPGNTNTSYQNGIANSTSNNYVLAPFWEDLYVNSSAQYVKYEITGTSPNRVLTVQWENVEIYNYAGPSINFQVKLYESDSHIEYVYGVMQGFDGTNPKNVDVPNGFVFDYTVGMSASTWGTPAAVGEIIALQKSNSLSFTSLGGITQNEGVNKLSILPECYSMYSFVPSGSVRANDPAPAIPTAPSNDEPSGAITLTALPTVPADFCGSFYSSAFATASSGIAAPVASTTADDDVWFKFQAISTNTTITVRGGGGYDAVMQLFNDGDYSTVLASKNANGLAGTSLTETITQADFNTVIGNWYQVRVYHAGGGTQATATANVTGGAITGFTMGANGSGYITAYGGVSVTATPVVYITDPTGAGAVAKVNITSGAITSISLQGSQGGAGYTSPTVTIAPPGFGVTGDFSIIVNATPDPPANDNICTATPITVSSTCSTTSGNTATATASPQAVCTGNADDDVWYSFTATTFNPTITVTPGSGTFNPAIQIFSSSDNTCTGTLTSVLCQNAVGAGGAEVATPSTLVSGNTYFVRVYHSGTGASTGAFTICITACDTVAIPVNEGLNSASINCWSSSIITDGSAVSAITPTLTYVTATTVHSGEFDDVFSPTEGSGFYKFNSYDCDTGDQIRLVSVPLNTTAVASFDVKFKWLNTLTYTNNDSVQVQYSLDGLTWTNAGAAIGRYDGSTLGWTSRTVTVPAAAAGQARVYVGFLFTGAYGGDTYIDDIRIVETPACVPPTNVVAGSVTNIGASISWDASTSTPADGYEYYYSTSSTEPTTLTVASGSVGAGILTAPISGLDANTDYYVWVRSVCDAATSTYSEWSSVESFTTLCNPVITFPWTEGFETTSTWLQCFSVIDNNADGATWALSTSQPHTGSRSAAMNSDGNTDNNDYLITPQMSLDATPKRLRFWVRANSTFEPDEISVRVSTTGKAFANFTNIVLASTPVTSTTYSQITVDLSAFANSDVYIAFVRNGSPADGWILYLDDVVIENIPTCFEPTGLVASNVTQSSATLQWTPPTPAPADGYEYYYSTSSTAPTNATTPSGSTGTGITSANISLLSAETQYYFWVRSVCSTGVDISAWSSVGSFYTGHCVPAPSSVDGLGITNVTVGTINNTTVDESGNYGNYTAQSTNVQQASTVPFSITYETGYTYDTAIFVDWNDDLDFSDSGETVYTGTSLGDDPTTLSGTFNVPLSASVGSHRMRIGGQDSGPVDPCYTGTYGTFEDYTLNVTAAPLCTGTPSAGTIPSSSAVCVGSTVQLVATGYSTGTGISFQWEESDDNGVGDAWADAVGGTGATTDTYTTPNTLTGTRYYRMRITCATSGEFAYTNTNTITASVCSFDVTRNTGISYSSIISTGNSFTWSTTSSTPAVNSNWQTDENTSTSVTFPFPFVYRGAVVSNFKAHVNGFVTLSNTAYNSQTALPGIGATTNFHSVVAPFWADLVTQGNPNTVASLQGASAPIKYQIDGTAPNRVLTVEWSNMETFLNAGPNLNFQVKFYETSNNIEFVYGSMEGFNGTTDYTYAYALGMNGETVGTPNANNLTSQQIANTRSFAATAVNTLNFVPDCNSSLVFTPGAYTTYVPGASAPANDEPGTAQALTVNSSPCTSLCGTYYSTAGATASAGISVCSPSAIGTPDDDVWFSFVATTADVNIRVYGGGGYNPVVQLFSDAGTTSVSCVNATGSGLTETLSATGLTPSATYYVRVYHSGTGNGTTPEISICVSEVITPPANDNIGGAVGLTVDTVCDPTYSPQPSILAATLSPQTACTGTPDDDVWYSFVASSTYQVVTVQSGSGYNAVLQVFSSSDNTPTGTLTSLTCTNNTSTAGVETYSSNTFVMGNTYFVRVYHFASGVGSGNFSVCVTSPSPVCVTSPTAPINGSNSCVSGTGTTLSWAAVTHATAYDVYLDTVDGTTLVSNDQTATSYTTPSPLASGTYFWRVVPLNANGEAAACSTFNFIKDPASVGGTIAAGTSTCGTDRGTLTLSGHTGNIVRWESSVAPFTTWTPITNTTTSYNVGALSVPTHYRVVVQSGACSTATSAEISVDAVSTTWNGTAWSNGVPNSGMAAVINGNYTASSDLAACSLTVSGGAVVAVGAENATTHAITAAYDFDISGPVTVQSGSLTFEQGSNLLQSGYTGSNTGNITVKAKVRVWRQDYVYWGSPVAGQKLNAFSPLTLWNRFYTFNPAGNAYAAVYASASDPALATYEFNPGTGYMVRAPNTFVNPNYAAPETQPWFTSQFTGVPNNGTVTVTTTNGVSNVHMISNPYPSTINANSTTGFLSVNPGTLYFWTHHDQTPGGNNYAMYNNLGGTAAYIGGTVPNGTIQVGQGFLFTNNNNLASVSFTNAMRMGNNEGQFFRTGNGNRSRIWLNVANGAVNGNQMLVGYTADATLGFDVALDGALIPNGNCISSMIGTDRYGIQARPAFSADDIVPMGLHAETAGTFTVSLDHADGVFEGNQDIFLKDNLTGVVTNLKQASYSFATESGDFNDRLQLQYVNTTLGIPGFDVNTVVIYKDDNEVLTINAGTIEMENVKIFDVRGRLVYTKEAISSNVAKLGDLKAEHQVLLVQITSTDGRIVTKKAAY